MLYPISSANGHAGEYFFAYKIASVLQWPCRLIDIDIGIDAQVEVLDETSRLSTGRFVAFQIKAREKEDQTYIYTTQEHLRYWRELQLPVFVVLVDLSAKKIYLHEVNLSRSYPLTAKGRIRIDFDLSKDAFKRSSGQKIALAGQRKSEQEVAAALTRVNAYSSEVMQTIKAAETDGMALELLDLMRGRFEIRAQLDHARGMASGLQAGKSLVKGAQDRLDGVLNDLRDCMKDGGMAVDWNDDGLVTAFINE